LELIRGYVTGTRTDIFMNFSINTEGGNNFIGSGVLDGNGIPPDFFNDVHIRRAFAYCFNYDAYLSDVLLGEGTRSLAVMLPGQPGYADDTPTYTYDPEKCAAEFAASELKSPDGKSINEIGFRLVLGYNTGNTARQTIGQILQAELSAVNELFVVEVTGLPWPTYLRTFRARQLPISTSGWVEDIDDTHNWVGPYALTTFANRQSLPQELKDQFAEIINRGVLESDPAKRHEIYKEFNQVYYEQIPTILLFFVNGRRYQQRWVEGWFYNRVHPGTYFYSMSKQ
jgi:peptide/nickel transport system substrate-binding protein